MRYHEHHRNVRIELQTDTSGRLMERLLGRDLDAALVVESPFSPPSGRRRCPRKHSCS